MLFLLLLLLCYFCCCCCCVVFVAVVVGYHGLNKNNNSKSLKILPTLFPSTNHTPPPPHLFLFQLHPLHQLPHARSLFLQFPALIPIPTIPHLGAVNARVVFRQPDQPDDKSGPVRDGCRRERGFVLAEFEGACFAWSSVLVLLWLVLARGLEGRGGQGQRNGKGGRK